MKIIVLNGSPKGDQSITMQYVRYIQKQFPQHELAIHNISQRIKKLENDEAEFGAVIEEVRTADGVIWAFPLYHVLVPAQYKRFIELVTERGAGDAFADKYATTLTTSIHFYDHTAHNYMNAVCDDLGMRYMEGFSAAMMDLLEPEGQKQVTAFARTFFDTIENRLPTTRNYPPLHFTPIEYVPGSVESQVDSGGRKVLVLTDAAGPGSNLGRMVERFRAAFAGEVEVINLNDLDIKGGCQGCMRCGYENVCSYGDTDEYMDFYKSKVDQADLLVIAGTIKDRYLSSRWKLFFDRSFFNTHQPVLRGKQMAALISGPLGQIPNLRQILELYPDFNRANLAGIVTDEYDSSEEIDGLLQGLAERMVRFAETGYVKPITFLGVGAMKIFRDDMYSHMRFPFVADHEYYKANNLYDFPKQFSRHVMMGRVLTWLVKLFPAMREDIYGKRMKSEMVKPFAKVLGE